MVSIAVFYRGQRFTVLRNNIRGKAGYLSHFLLLNQNHTGFGLKQRMNIVKNRHLAINRQQRRNHTFVHIVAGVPYPHGEGKFFLAAGEKLDNPFFAGEMNSVGGQQLL